MKERTAFDILIENLKKRGIEPISNRIEKSFVVPGSDRFYNLKYIIAPIEDSYFIACDSFSAKQYTSSTYSGIYSSFDRSRFNDCKVYKKDWVDLFFRKNKKKTGIDYIDNNLTITSKSTNNPAILLKYNDIKEFLSLHDKITPLKMIFEKDYIQIIDSLKDKSVVGIETNYWVYQEEVLDLLLDKGIHLINNLKNACA
jgi:hypothetical protein